MEFIDEVKARFETTEQFYFPITHLCNMKVDLVLSKLTVRNKDGTPMTRYFIRIINDSFCCVYKEHQDLYYQPLEFGESIETLMKSVDDLLENVQFDKVCNRFVIGAPKKSIKSYKALYEKYKNNEKIKLSYGECAVCYDITTSKTSCCGQVVCLNCHQKLAEKRDYDEEERPEFAECPLCKEDYLLNVI